jgi:FMN reductase
MGDGDLRAPLVVGIGGSTSATSTTALLLGAALAQAAQRGARTLAVMGEQLATLPIYGATDDPTMGALELIESVRAADAVIIATPGYHGGMSGLVKNAIDHLEALRDDERPYLDGRAVGLIVAASGWQACGTTLVSVRSAVHALRGWPTPFGVTVNSAQQHPMADGSFGEPVAGALGIMVGEVLDFVSWRAAAASLARVT